MSWSLEPNPGKQVCKPTCLGFADPLAWGLQPHTIDLQTRSLGFAEPLA